MKSFLILLVSFFFINGNIVVDKDLQVGENNIVWKNNNNRSVRCIDRIKGDTITVFMSRSGLAGYIFSLQLIGKEKYVNVYQWSDYPQFDGESTIKVGIKKFKLRINKESFKIGDTLKAKFSVNTIKDKYSEKLCIKGKINHVINGKGFH